MVGTVFFTVGDFKEYQRSLTPVIFERFKMQCLKEHSSEMSWWSLR